MTFYLKYRPQKLEELDITEARESLKKIVSSGKIPHAFLFSGPKGTGKTSAARILAKILNCEKKGKEPCNKCDQCVSITKGSNIDVIELDAASHRGIDDVRTLRDAVKLAPAKARKKVYIIDEAHMLTTEASNALLKTLEEPPAHVNFILATTNPEKLIETIKSRATQIGFRKAAAEEVANSLERILKGEKIKIEKDGLGLIAKAAGGSFRDGAKLLEQLVSEKKKPTKEAIEEFLFTKKTFDIDEFAALLLKKDAKALIEEISEITKRGGSVEALIDAAVTKFRGGLLAKVGVGEDKLSSFSKDELISLIELFTSALSELKTTTIEELPVEIAVIRWCEQKSSEQSEFARSDFNSSAGSTGTGHVPSRSRSLDAPALDSSETRKHSPTPHFIKEISDDMWKKILELTRPINASIEALLRAARPVGYDGKTLTLGVFYRFHKERLEDGHHRRVLEEVVASVLGTPARIVCVLTEPPIKQVVEEVSAKGGSASGGKKEESVLTEGEDKDIIKVAEEIFGN